MIIGNSPHMSRKVKNIEKLCNILPTYYVKFYHYVEKKFPIFRDFITGFRDFTPIFRDFIPILRDFTSHPVTHVRLVSCCFTWKETSPFFGSILKK
jgi:hypothetical protein